MDPPELEAQKLLTKAAASGEIPEEPEDADRARLESEEEKEARGHPKRGRGRGRGQVKTPAPKQAKACLKKPSKRDLVEHNDPVRRRLFHSGSEGEADDGTHHGCEDEDEEIEKQTFKKPSSRSLKRPAAAAAPITSTPKRRALQD